MFSGLMEGVAGVRGIVGVGLTPDIACRYAAAYGVLLGGGEVIVGMDGRPSGPMLFNAVAAGLQSVGCNVLNIGIVPTPTIQIMIAQRGSKGGIAITASHNPQQWNALKFFSTSSLFLDEKEGEELRKILKNDKIEYSSWDHLGAAEDYADAIDLHIKTVMEIPYLNLSAIRRRGFKVALDCINGASSLLMPDLLKELGCTVFPVNCEANGIFPHEAEPIPENLTQLSDLVKETGADLGVALDPDGDRLAMIDENGIPIGEEYTLALATDFILQHNAGSVVTNVSTTKAIDDIAARYGVHVHRTKVGEVHVAKRMASEGAVIGGEGNGGVILPEVHLGRDAPVGVALTLQYLTESEESLSEVLSQLPRYEIVKHKVSILGADKEKILEHLRNEIQSEAVDETDGLKFINANNWVQVRASNTEPIIRIFAEAPYKSLAEELSDKVKVKIRQLTGDTGDADL